MLDYPICTNSRYEEMGDSYRLPCGMYYCCHVTDGRSENHVHIGVAVAILLFILLLVVVGMITGGIE